jgi:6,7-dimethyl-8-ribityllumazine synthase
MLTIEGNLIPPAGARFALLATRFNDLIVDQLVKGARDALVRHGVPETQLTQVKVPGAWEASLACKQLAESGKYDAVVVLGAVIRGATPHFDYVAGEVAKGASQAALSTGVVVTFGVLTTDTIEQALERAGTKAGNKGADAALAALEMVSLKKQLSVL